MKKFLLSFIISATTLVGLCQTPCPNTFDVLNNGAGGQCPNDFPGNGVQPASASYKRDGLIQITFGSPIPLGTNPPVLVALRVITSPIGAPVTTTGPTLDFRLSLVSLDVTRTIAQYCFFSQNNLNLNNGSGSRYQVDVTYIIAAGDVNKTCNIQQSEVPIPLPVTFKSFNVNRKNVSTVGVSWTTASEQNNRGLNVQRNDGTGWRNVAYVFSQTVAGTSSSDLSYEFNDANTEKGVSQYRIQQVDLDGRASFSIIRAIRGENIAAKLLVYPNPSSTGNINVVFENGTGVRDISVSDATGRLVKSFKSITNSVLLIENLRKGFYTLKVTNRTTAASSVEKVVIK